MPVLYDNVNMTDKGYDKLAAQFFKTLPCMASGPQALLEFILAKSLRIFLCHV